MDSITIESDRLNLILETPEEVLARIDAMPPADRAQVSPQWLAQMRAETHANPWKHGFRMVDRASRIVVGGCAFKGPPDYHSAVEIAYGVEPEYRQRGYATEAAQIGRAHV